MKRNKHAGHVRKFRIQSQAWYALAVQPEDEYKKGHDTILMGFYRAEGGGSSGEIRIDWETLGDKVTPRLKVYDDSWSALANFQDVVLALAELDDTDPSVDQVAEVLRKCGIIDATERVREAGGFSSLSAVTVKYDEQT